MAPLALISQEAEFMDICAHHKKSPGQILLRFVLELGAILLTRSTKKERLSENLNIFDFSLMPQDLTYLSAWTHKDFAPQNNKKVRPPQKLDSVLAQKEG